MIVYLLAKHRAHPFVRGDFLKSCEVVGVYASRAEPDRIASEKNARKPHCVWAAHRKQVKE